MGLEETRHISRIIISPGDPHIVCVAAMGHLWGPNEERGIYKTIDGGKTWTKILYINENTGFADLALELEDSLILYAAACEHRRILYQFTSGGLGSGLYKTTDGGKTWKRLKKDLPEGILGRNGKIIVDDYFRIKDISNIQISPDKKNIAFVSNRTGDDDNNDNTGIWIVSSEGGEPQQITTNVGADSVHKQEFYPDMLQKSDSFVCGSKLQCFRSGELHHALDVGIISQDADITELGESTDAVPGARTRKRLLSVI